MASRRSSASSSSSKSASRVTRNGWCASTSMPGNRASSLAAMTCSSRTKCSPSGSGTKRGSSGGTFTRANRSSPLDGIAHGDGQVQGQVGDVGERVRGVDRQRREDREDRVDEHLLEVGPVVVGQVVPVGEADPFVLERRHDLVGEHRCRPVDEFVDPAPDRAQLVDEVEPVGGGGAQAGLELLHETRDPHLEELVEVLAEDGEELGSLEQRQAVVLGQGEHAGVELEPRELAVEEALGSSAERRSPVRDLRGCGVQPGHRPMLLPNWAFRTGLTRTRSPRRCRVSSSEGHEH